MSDTFAPAQPHEPIETLFDDVFMVTGQFQMAPLVRITRNMIIVRHDGALTLINAVRLTPDGERRLEALGEVKHLVRLGAFHSVDDRYFMDRYSPVFWASGRQRSLKGLTPDHDLDRDDLELPFPDAEVFNFQCTKFPESALVLGGVDGGLLVTCDAVQNLCETRGASLAARAVTNLLGLKCVAGVAGKPWTKAMAGGDVQKLRPDFERLLAEHRFEHLATAHGPLLRGGAHAAVTESVAKRFG